MGTSRRFSLVAAIAFFTYAGVSWLVGEHFPFSRFDMYAGGGARHEGAIFTVLADGANAQIEEFERVGGIDPAAIYPEGIPCSMEYRVAEAKSHLERHLAPAGSAPGPVRLQIGYRMVRLEGNRVEENMRIVAEGTAWRR